MQFIIIDLSLSIEALDTLKKLREDAVYSLHQVRLEIVEIRYCAHLRYAHSNWYWNGKCMWNSGKDVSETLGIKAIVVSAKVIVIFAWVSQNPFYRLIVY